MKQETKREYLLLFAWIVAFVATTGSLYLSEFMLYEPCKLCWYQRIFMYPLVILIGVAIVKKDTTIAPYIFGLAIPGACISLYHIAIQKIPFLSESHDACGRVPCTIDYLNWFGFITIPMLCLIAFLLIIISMILLQRSK
ncbi:MAG: disulfide oxidoreductase [Bacillaceae bacterium]